MREINNHKIFSNNDHNLKNNTLDYRYGRKSNNLKKLTPLKLLSIFLVLLISAIFIFLSRKKIEDTSPFIIQNSNPSDTSPNNMGSTLPIENGIYLTGDRSLFYTNSNTKKYVEDKVVKSDDYRGKFTRLDESKGKYSMSWESYDFRNLKEPKLIYTSTPPAQLYDITSSRTDRGGSYIYISVIFSGEQKENKPLDSNTEINKIIQIDTSKDTVKEIWSNYLAVESRYGSAEGSAYIKEVVENKYLVFDIFGCYGCEGGPTNTIVLNIDTGKEKFYEGVIDEIRVDIEKNTISYKKTQRVKQNCDFYACGTTLKTIDEIMEDSLP